MASEARHLGITVRAIIQLDAQTELEIPRLSAKPAHQFGPRSLGIETGCIGVDTVLDQANFPFECGINNRALDKSALTIFSFGPFEPSAAIGVAQKRQVIAPWRCSRSAGPQRGIGIGGAVAILATNLDRIGHFAIDQSVTVAVLRVMTIGALHALFGMDAHQVNGLARIGARLDELAFVLATPFLRIVRINDIVILIEQIAFAITLEDRAEIPPVAMIVGKS